MEVVTRLLNKIFHLPIIRPVHLPIMNRKLKETLVEEDNLLVLNNVYVRESE